MVDVISHMMDVIEPSRRTVCLDTDVQVICGFIYLCTLDERKS